ncbi:MAG: glycosyltransferase [bacterium]
MRLSIVVPAHNEEHRLGRMLDAYLPAFAARYGADVEFLVVVNGSTDGTEGLLRSYAARYPQVRCLVEPARVGKGGALMLGFRAASGNMIGFVDADGSTPPAAFQELVDRIGDAGAIIASRWRAGAVVSPRQPFARRFASRLFNRLTNLMFGLRLTDTQCGAKLMRREALLNVLPHLGITRWAFDVDLLFQLRRAGFSVDEVPTRWHDVEGSKVQVGRASAEMLAALIRLRLIYSPFRWVVTLYDRTIVPFLHPPGFEDDHLVRHSILLMATAQVGNLANLLYQVAMIRMLNASEYGVLAAMLGMWAGASGPIGAMNTSVTYYTARLAGEGRRADVAPMVVAVLRDTAWVLIPLLAIAYFERNAMAHFFNLSTPGPFLLAASALAFSLWSSVVGGALSGVQAFVWASAGSMVWGILRLMLGMLVVAAGAGAVAALWGHWWALAAGLVVTMWGVHVVLGRLWARPARPSGMYVYCGRYLVALTGYSVLANADVVLVKKFFDPLQAGLFAKAAMLARIAFFLPQPVAGAMFPKVVSGGESSVASWHTLLKGLALVSVLVAGVGGVCTLFAPWIMGLLANTRDPQTVFIFRAMIWALAPLTLLVLVMNYELAQRRFSVTIPLLAGALGYLGAVKLWHTDISQIIIALAVASTATLLVAVALLPRTRSLPIAENLTAEVSQAGATMEKLS